MKLHIGSLFAAICLLSADKGDPGVTPGATLDGVGAAKPPAGTPAPQTDEDVSQQKHADQSSASPASGSEGLTAPYDEHTKEELRAEIARRKLEDPPAAALKDELIDVLKTNDKANK